jgi:hypothetical protein
MSRRANKGSANRRLKHSPQNKKKGGIGKLFDSAKKRLVWLVSVVVTVSSLFCTYYAFNSNIDLQSENAVDRSDPFSTPFTLNNEGWLPIKNVGWTFSLIRAGYERKIEFKNISVLQNTQIAELNSGQKNDHFYVGLP